MQPELSYVRLGKNAWSIARLTVEALEWWCGEKDEWVSPHSSWWCADWNCVNQIFPSLQKARTFARAHGWE
jgi:hypothetical protein